MEKEWGINCPRGHPSLIPNPPPTWMDIFSPLPLALRSCERMVLRLERPRVDSRYLVNRTALWMLDVSSTELLFRQQFIV